MNLIVCGPTAPNEITFANEGSFTPILRIGIDNGKGVLTWAKVVIEDLSGKFDPALSSFGSAAAPLIVDSIGRISSSCQRFTAATGSGTARFTISNLGYVKQVVVSYEILI